MSEEKSRFTRVLIVRHGETEWNREGRIQGHLDSPLTEKGIAQAESVGARLRGTAFEAIYASDLPRAFETAKRIASENGSAVTPEPRLRERALGIFEGLTEAEINERYPRDWERFVSRDPDYKIPGGESARERLERSSAVLDQVVGRHPGGTVLLVTHGGILDAIFRIVVGLPIDTPRHFKIWNAGINVISRPARGGAATGDTGGLGSGGPAGRTGDGWMIELWGDTGTIFDGAALDDT